VTSSLENEKNATIG